MTTVQPGSALAPTSAHPPAKTLAPAKSLLERARENNDQEAIALMFRQFLPETEQVIAGHYLGSQGFFWTKVNSLACITPSRIAVLFVTPLSQVTYQDGLLTALRTASLYQPSRLQYVAARIIGFPVRILSIFTGGFLGLSGRRLARSTGMALNIDGGATIYLFSDRKLLGRLNSLYRIAVSQPREQS